jgi:hypothetical protein
MSSVCVAALTVAASILDFRGNPDPISIGPQLATRDCIHGDGVSSICIKPHAYVGATVVSGYWTDGGWLVLDADIVFNADSLGGCDSASFVNVAVHEFCHAAYLLPHNTIPGSIMNYSVVFDPDNKLVPDVEVLGLHVSDAWTIYNLH